MMSKWEVKTNVHSECGGEQWGWIDGPSIHLCWSNKSGSQFTKNKAESLCFDHNKEIPPQPTGLLEAEDRLALAQMQALDVSFGWGGASIRQALRELSLLKDRYFKLAKENSLDFIASELKAALANEGKEGK
jgi:hypothetical protein